MILDPNIRNILLYFAALLGAVGLAGIMAVVFFRKRHHRRHEHHSHSSFSSASAGGSSHSGRRRRRRHHRERPRNPTRAETGGLPLRNDLDADSAP